MPSKNVLLGSGVPEEKPIDKHIEPTCLRTPVWRYHKDFPQGKVCKNDVELDKADAEGWVDHPGKVRLILGHEKVWEKQNSIIKVDKIKEEMAVEEVKVESPAEVNSFIEVRSLPAENNETEQKAEDENLVSYKEAKNPPGPRLCTLCGKTFSSIRALNMHGLGAHRNRKKEIL